MMTSATVVQAALQMVVVVLGILAVVVTKSGKSSSLYHEFSSVSLTKQCLHHLMETGSSFTEYCCIFVSSTWSLFAG